MITKEKLEELLMITEDLIESSRTNMKKLEEIIKIADEHDEEILLGAVGISKDDFSRQLFELNKAELQVRQIKKELK